VALKIFKIPFFFYFLAYFGCLGPKMAKKQKIGILINFKVKMNTLQFSIVQFGCNLQGFTNLIFLKEKSLKKVQNSLCFKNGLICLIKN